MGRLMLATISIRHQTEAALFVPANPLKVLKCSLRPLFFSFYIHVEDGPAIVTPTTTSLQSSHGKLLLSINKP
jgi:hypothetical protein